MYIRWQAGGRLEPIYANCL